MSPKGAPVAREVDEPALTGHVGVQMTPRAPPEVGHARSVHDDGIEPESRDVELRHGVAVVGRQAVAACLAPYVVLPRRRRASLRDGTAGRLPRLELLVEFRLELPLLVGCVRRRERVLPEVHGGCPNQDADADDEEERAEAMSHGRITE
jgi:hypothetical protein